MLKKKQVCRLTHRWRLIVGLSCFKSLPRSVELRDPKVKCLDREQSRDFMEGTDDRMNVLGKNENTFHANQSRDRL